MDQEQLDRIRRMEQSLNEAVSATEGLEESLRRFDSVLPGLQALVAYYEGELWRKDYDDDAAGRIPADLPRGVLAEDTVYDLLTDVRYLREAMLSLCRQLAPRTD